MFAFFMYKSGSDVVVATLGRVSLPLHRPAMAPQPSLPRGLRGPPPGGPLCELSHLRGPRVLRLPMAGLGSWPPGIFPKPSSWETLGFATGQAGREASAITCPRVCGPLILPVQTMGLGSSRRLSCWLCLHLNLRSD